VYNNVTENSVNEKNLLMKLRVGCTLAKESQLPYTITQKNPSIGARLSKIPFNFEIQSTFWITI